MIALVAVAGLFALDIAAISEAVADGEYAQRPQVRTYIKNLVAKHQFDHDELTALFKQAKQQKSVLAAIRKPQEAKPWYEYKDLFITQQRIAQGISFWEKNRSLLRKIEEQYRIPAEIILAIIGIETVYGENMGTLPVMDTLITLGFDYPRRAKFFRSELTQFFLLLREDGLHHKNLKGSYAGAIGIGQFIPSSYREYSVDYDGDSKRDLVNSVPDALASVANYLKRHGWEHDGEIANMVIAYGTDEIESANNGYKPSLNASDAKQLGIDPLLIRRDRFALFSFKTDQNNMQHWAGYHNFYVITRYNHSRRYALAVYQLSEEIKRNMATAADRDL